MIESKNSIEKGDEFEEKVYNLFKKLLDNPNFYLNSKASKIFRKKSYYSEQRQSNIEFDISIETYQQGAEMYSTLTLIECKNYDGYKVPSSDIDVFSSQINQVGEHNTKGYFISNTAFQSGAFNLARSKKIALAIINTEGTFEWLNYRKEKKALNNNLLFIESQLTQENKQLPFFSYLDEWAYEGLPDMLINAGIIDLYIPDEKHIKIKYKNEHHIDEQIRKLNVGKHYNHFKLDTDKLCSVVSELYNVRFIFSESLGTHR